MALTLIVNGVARHFPALDAPCPLPVLLSALALKSDRIAVECNGEIVTRAVWAETIVAEGYRLEIVHFVGGGL